LRKQIEVGSNLNLSIERKKYKKKIQIVTWIRISRLQNSCSLTFGKLQIGKNLASTWFQLHARITKEPKEGHRGLKVKRNMMMQTCTKCFCVLGGIPQVFFWFVKSLPRGQVNVVGQSLIVHVVTLRGGGGINAWQIHQFWSPARPNKYSFLGPIPRVYIYR
jgi:hypothetical protein